MEQEKHTFFPNGIQALIVDGDMRFSKKASMLLPILNFKVATCASTTSVLELLMGDKLKDVDVVLVDSEKAATCGFNFRGFIEANLRIPVIYTLSLDHEGKGDKANEQLHTLSEATHIIRKQLDVNEVSTLWRVIAWRKCYLEVSVNGASKIRMSPAIVPVVRPGPTFNDKGKEKECICFEVIRGVKDWKMNGINNASGSSRTSVIGHNDKELTQRHRQEEEGQERDNLDAHKQKKCCGQKTIKNCGSTSRVQKWQAADAQHQPGQRQQPLFVQSVLKTLDLPSYNPNTIFVDYASSSNNAAFFASANNNATPPCEVNSEPAPILHPGYQQQIFAPQNFFGNISPPLEAVTTMATTVTYEPQFSYGNQHQEVCPPLMFEPFPHQNIPQPIGDFFMGIAGGSAIDAGAYGNAANSHIQYMNLGAEQQGEDELAARMPQHVSVAANEREMAALYSANHSAGLLVASGQDLVGMDLDVINPTMPGGASSTLFIDLQGPVTPLDGNNQLGPLENMNGSLVGSAKSPGAALDGSAGPVTMFPSSDQYEESTMFPFTLEDFMDLDAPIYEYNDGHQGGATGSAATDNGNAGLAEMLPTSDQYGESITFPFTLEHLLDLDAPIYEYNDGLDGHQGGTAGSAAAASAAGASLLSEGGGSMENWDVGAAEGLEIFDEFFMKGTEDFIFPQYMNNGHE